MVFLNMQMEINMKVTMKNGKRSGSGTFKYMNGDIYTGNWKEGKRFGDGSFVYSNGEKQTGIWEDGRLLLK